MRLNIKRTAEKEMERKHIKVVAAVIRNGDQIFATQRGYGNYKDCRERDQAGGAGEGITNNY